MSKAEWEKKAEEIRDLLINIADNAERVLNLLPEKKKSFSAFLNFTLAFVGLIVAVSEDLQDSINKAGEGEKDEEEGYSE